MKKRLFCAVLSLLLMAALMLPGVSVTSQAAETAVSQARNSIAVVSTWIDRENGQSTEKGWGTGFFVGVSGEDPQYLLTNHHVIKTFLDEGAGERKNNYRAIIRVFFSSNDYVEAYMVDYDESKDIALLRLASPTDQRVPLKLCSPTEGMVGSTVYTVGYPGLAENKFISAVSSWGATDATVNKGSLSRLTLTSGTGVSTIQTDAVIMSGHSGGPMVNEDGEVLGINTKSVYTTSGTNDQIYYAVNIDEVMPMLTMHSVAFETSSGSSSSSTRETTEATQPESTQPATTQPATVQPEPQSKQGTNTGLVVGVVVLAVAAAVVVLMLARKKKPAAQADIQKTAPAPQQNAASDGLFRFQGISGVYAGKRFSVNGTVRFGRGPKNDIVFPANTQGVSGDHCALICQNGRLYIQDLGSSYGTFLGNGQKLVPNQMVELKMGDRFSLGSQTETFAIVPKGGI